MTQEDFDRLLAWLDPDRERAGRKYEEIRLRLMKLFASRGCGETDLLADEAINRVARRLPELLDTYVGDPASYFCGVAHRVHLEYLRRKPPAPPPPARPAEEVEREYACLESCMAGLAADSRELVLQYYTEEKQARIEHRKELARRLGINLNALRIRAFRIRAALQQCVEDCLKKGGG